MILVTDADRKFVLGVATADDLNVSQSPERRSLRHTHRFRSELCHSTGLISRWCSCVLIFEYVIGSTTTSYVHIHLHGNRLEHVETICSRRDHTSRYLRVPVNLLDILLTLVNEEQLRWDVLEPFPSCGQHLLRSSLVLILFNGQIPQCDLVISP